MATDGTAAIFRSAAICLALAACSAPVVDTSPARAKNEPAPAAGDPATGNGAAPGNPVAPAGTGASCAPGPAGIVDTSALDPFFTAQMQAAKVPGLSVAVVGGGRIKWAKGYGLADIAQNKPVTTDTVFMLASVSKTVTAVALMQLVEDPARGLSLDQDIDGKLPFTVRNPRFPSMPITYRMLLTHTSSLIDSDAYWALAEPDPLPQGDSPIPLLGFDRSYVAKADSWSTSAPGTAFSYSNTGASITGLLVETISGMNLQAYAKAHVFEPLGMNESSFFLRDLDVSHIAMPYDGTPPVAQGHYGYPDYPDGQMRTSAPQLARFLLMFAQKGQCGQRLLKEATVATMETVQLPAVDPGQGIIWYYDTKAGTRVLGHRGGDKGVSTDMFFDPASGSGYVLLSNGSTNTSGTPAEQAAMDAMNEKLLALSKTLP
jgi:CubicO group peptidase (beta-lactamase class C family)